MDNQTQDFISTFGQFMREVVDREGTNEGPRLTPLGNRIQEFLDQDLLVLPVLIQRFPAHRLVDVDLALRALDSNSGAEVIGVGGGQARDHSSFAELLASQFMRFAPAAVDYLSVARGAGEAHRAVSFGIHLLTFEGHPLAVLQRAAAPEIGRQGCSLEILTADPDVASRYLDEVDRLMVSLSVIRGQIVTFTSTEFGAGSSKFLERPTVAAEEVILAPGVLDRIVRHVVGIAEHREELKTAGQHLKRGVLLYGPPGTGKTLTIRHLLSRTPDTTAVLLTGPSIGFITEAAELARLMQPAIVVLEDVDLVATERGMNPQPQPLLFAILDALDGLDGDADITFILTTNRVEDLERALAERPGRIDLAVELGLPGAEERLRLFHHYAKGLSFSAAALGDAARQAEGTTGSFAKELIRRAVVHAAIEHRERVDADLAAALEELLAGSELLTRRLLGGSSDSARPEDLERPTSHRG